MNLFYSLYKEINRDYEFDVRVDKKEVIRIEENDNKDAPSFVKKAAFIEKTSAYTKEDILSIKHLGLINYYKYEEAEFSIKNFKYIFENIFRSAYDIPLPKVTLEEKLFLSEADSLDLPETTLEENLYFSEADLVPLPEVTLNEELYLSEADLVPLPEVTSEEELYLSNIEGVTESINKNSIGEEYLYFSEADLVPLPEVTLNEELYLSEADLVPLPEVTSEEELYLSNIEGVTESINKNSIGEEYLSDSLEGNFFPEGY